jgi:hypothetical protein
MASREQMFERGVAACFRDSDEEESLATTLGFDENYAREVVVPLILDAILPQVTTVAELEALPPRTRLLGADGATWQRNSTGSWISDQYLTRRSETLLALKKAQPLTVIWQPEVTR